MLITHPDGKPVSRLIRLALRDAALFFFFFFAVRFYFFTRRFFCPLVWDLILRKALEKLGMIDDIRAGHGENFLLRP